eukprot:1595232-Rhodomonas_salina.3
MQFRALDHATNNSSCVEQIALKDSESEMQTRTLNAMLWLRLGGPLRHTPSSWLPSTVRDPRTLVCAAMHLPVSNNVAAYSPTVHVRVRLGCDRLLHPEIQYKKPRSWDELY